MKKTYIDPTIKIVKIKPALLLSGSEQIKVGSNYDGTTTIESRRNRGSIWDDEEEE